MKKVINEKFCDVMSYLTIMVGAVLIALVIMNHSKIISFVDRTILNQNEDVASLNMANDNTELKHLDESERVLMAVKKGGQYINALNSREINLYNEVIRFKNSVKGKSDYEIVLAAHDWVIDNVTYDDDAAKEDNELSYVADSTSAYGGLVDNYTICGGYAKSYQLLAESCGIQTYYVVGKVSDDYHAWNISYINGEYYAIDCTYDDYSNDRYKYFMVSDKFMKNDGREWNYEEFPSCTNTQYEFEQYIEISSEDAVIKYVVESLKKEGKLFVKTAFEIDCFYDICELLNSDFVYSKTNMNGYNYYVFNA